MIKVKLKYCDQLLMATSLLNIIKLNIINGKICILHHIASLSVIGKPGMTSRDTREATLTDDVHRHMPIIMQGLHNNKTCVIEQVHSIHLNYYLRAPGERLL